MWVCLLCWPRHDCWSGARSGEAAVSCSARCHSLLCFPLSTTHWTQDTACWTLRHGPLSHLCKPQLCPLTGLTHCLLLTNSHARPGHHGKLRPPRLAGGPRHGQLRGRRALRHPCARAQCECSLCCRATCHVSRVTPLQAGRVEPCTRAMFGNKSAVALLACEAQFALQRNWYPDPIQVAAAWLP